MYGEEEEGLLQDYNFFPVLVLLLSFYLFSSKEAPSSMGFNCSKQLDPTMCSENTGLGIVS